MAEWILHFIVRIIHIWIINELNEYLIKREGKTYDNNNNLYMWNIYNQWECNIKINEKKKKKLLFVSRIKNERVKNGTILFQLPHLIFRIDLNIMGIFLIFFIMRIIHLIL